MGPPLTAVMCKAYTEGRDRLYGPAPVARAPWAWPPAPAAPCAGPRARLRAPPCVSQAPARQTRSTKKLAQMINQAKYDTGEYVAAFINIIGIDGSYKIRKY